MLDDCWNDLNDFGLFWTVHMNRQDRLGVGKGTVMALLPPPAHHRHRDHLRYIYTFTWYEVTERKSSD
jgi:hypothetical protein